MPVLPETWAGRMKPDIAAKAEMLWTKAEELRAAGEIILPPRDAVFRALVLTPPESVRCVILGQDPYPAPDTADGLAFSSRPGQKIPASLRNIFRELSDDIGCPMPSGPDLTPWAQQGVLLLNTVLTVRAGEPTSHAAWGWQSVTGEILRVCMELPQPVAFLFWGRHAHKIAQTLDFSRNKQAFYASHPSPLGARKASAEIPAFLGSRPFSSANQYLISKNAGPVEWRLP